MRDRSSGRPRGGTLSARESTDTIVALTLDKGLTAGDYLRAAVILVAALALAVGLRAAARRVVGRSDPDAIAGVLLGRALAALVVAGGIVYALSAINVRLGPLLGALGIGGIAVAFALQEVLSNVAAGVILQVSRPFRRGDQITTGDFDGTVRDINLRAVYLRTFDGQDVYVPNRSVLGGPIVNRTRTPSVRTTLEVGVDYDTDLAHATGLMRDAAQASTGVLSYPAAEAWVTEFGDSSITIAVRYWHAADMPSYWRVRDAVAQQVKRALDAAQITIPFPQRVLSQRPGAWPASQSGPAEH